MRKGVEAQVVAINGVLIECIILIWFGDENFSSDAWIFIRFLTGIKEISSCHLIVLRDVVLCE
jgi:hypothetical protein